MRVLGRGVHAKGQPHRHERRAAGTEVGHVRKSAIKAGCTVSDVGRSLRWSRRRVMWASSATAVVLATALALVPFSDTWVAADGALKNVDCGRPVSSWFWFIHGPGSDLCDERAATQLLFACLTAVVAVCVAGAAILSDATARRARVSIQAGIVRMSGPQRIVLLGDLVVFAVASWLLLAPFSFEERWASFGHSGVEAYHCAPSVVTIREFRGTDSGGCEFEASDRFRVGFVALGLSVATLAALVIWSRVRIKSGSQRDGPSAKGPETQLSG